MALSRKDHVIGYIKYSPLNEIEFLIENHYNFRKTKLFKFFFPKKSRFDGLTVIYLKDLPCCAFLLELFGHPILIEYKGKFSFRTH